MQLKTVISVASLGIALYNGKQFTNALYRQTDEIAKQVADRILLKKSKYGEARAQSAEGIADDLYDRLRTGPPLDIVHGTMDDGWLVIDRPRLRTAMAGLIDDVLA